jgi:trehalose 6-phosphate phosphatase
VPADLDAFARRADEAGIFLDFDGCLAPIVPDPESARPLRGVRTTLARLAKRFALVAIVSGRQIDDLRLRVPVRGVRYVGLHGLEIDGIAFEGAEPLRAAVARVATALEASLRSVEGAAIERKGLALAVHFRRAIDPAAAELAAAPIVGGEAEREGLEVVPGRRILEVRPPRASKGSAVQALVAGGAIRAALVAGDDVGDISAFEAAGELEMALRVAVASAEAPRPLIDAADLVVDSPAELLAMLRRLVPRSGP